MDTLGEVPHVCPALDNDNDLERWTEWAVSQLDLSKSAGYDGMVVGCTL